MILQQDYPGNLMVYSADDKLYREGMTLSDEFALSAIIVGSHYQRQLIFSPPEKLWNFPYCKQTDRHRVSAGRDLVLTKCSPEYECSRCQRIIQATSPISYRYQSYLRWQSQTVVQSVPSISTSEYLDQQVSESWSWLWMNIAAWNFL